ncbi:MAG TPA: hypothetical protein PLH21_02575 [Chiayiivirga sp.]|nr:hypothetical protein [Chiayiivirga sp.]
MIPGKITAVIALLALLLGFGIGNAWQKGRAAVAQNVELRRQQDADRKAINDLKTAAQTLRQTAVDQAAANREAADRFAALATQLETDRAGIQAFTERQRAALDALAARRPDLRDLRLGDDILRHWRDSNAGRAAPAAEPAAAPGPAGQPAPAVPGAAGADQRHGTGADRQPRPRRGAVSRVRGAHGLAGAGDGRLGGARSAVVLQGRHRVGADPDRMRREG